jgi:transposase-like protein
MNKRKKRSTGMDAETYSVLKEHLYSGKPLLGEESPFSEMLQNMVNTILEGEMDHFLDTEASNGNKNKRNGLNRKRVMSQGGPLDIETPRDRNSNFKPELIGKRERFLSSGLDEQILALYAQGNSVEDVKRLLHKMLGVDISAGKISQITDKVLPELQEWRTRPLESFYPVIYLDAMHFKVRKNGVYEQTAFYSVYSINWSGQRDLLGLYINGHEGANKWGMVLQDLKSRGVQDVLVMCTDNLKGFSEVITQEFPSTVVQKCIVHQMRNSLKYVDDKDRKKVAVDLRRVYTSTTQEAARSALAAFGVTWGKKYEYIVQQWESNWDELMAFLDFPEGMRKMIYTTNPVEALHRIVRKLIKSKAAWSSTTGLMKQLFLSLTYNEKSWKKNARGWSEVRRAILAKYPNRVPNEA